MAENPAKKRILILSSLYPPHLGGVEKYTQSMAQALSADFDVHVFCMNTENLAEIRQEGAATVHSLPCRPLFQGRLPLPKRASLERFQRFLAEQPVDFAIIQTRLYPFNLQAANLLTAANVPTIVIEHGTGHIRYQPALINPFWKLYEHTLTSRFQRLPLRYFGVSRASSAWLRHFGIQSQGEIPNGVALADFEAIPAGWRKTRGIAQDALLITFAGRILKEKGVLTLLEAAAPLLDAGVAVVIAGGGEMALLADWKEHPNVYVLGQVAHAELLAILKDSQVFCLPTAYPEGLPTVILEAGALGVPVVATAKGGTAEVIQDQQTGLIVPPADSGALRAALEILLHDPAWRAQMGANLRALILERYTWAVIGQQLRQLILSPVDTADTSHKNTTPS